MKNKAYIVSAVFLGDVKGILRALIAEPAYADPTGGLARWLL
jgi:hypothetical protein